MATLRAFGDHGDLTRAADALQRAEAAGVDLVAITAQLERDGVQAFRASYGELIASIERKLTLTGCGVIGPAAAISHGARRVNPARGR